MSRNQIFSLVPTIVGQRLDSANQIQILYQPVCPKHNVNEVPLTLSVTSRKLSDEKKDYGVIQSNYVVFAGFKYFKILQFWKFCSIFKTRTTSCISDLPQVKRNV